MEVDFFSFFPFLRFVVCVLTESCIAPSGSKVKCNDVFYDTKQPELFNAYDECYRYDQSASNLLRLQMLIVDGDYRELTGLGRIPEWNEKGLKQPVFFTGNTAKGSTGGDAARRQPTEDETANQ